MTLRQIGAEPMTNPTQPNTTAHTIYALQCPFSKRNFPVVGSFGSLIREVVIIPVETWSQLCREIPGLAAAKFNVGTME